MADVRARGAEFVVNFDGVGMLTPRGQYNIELYLSFLRLQGQGNDFKIQYSSVARVFCLPKPDQPFTFVVVTLDPPIQEGETLYPHIVMQFETNTLMETTLSMSEELYNAKYEDKLKLKHKGYVHEIFTKILVGLSEAKVTKPGEFRNEQNGYTVKCSHEAEDGVLFPLEDGFFFLPKPPILILYKEINYVEFHKHDAGGSTMHHFDLLIKLESNQEHLFRNFRRNSFAYFFEFIVHKRLKSTVLGTGKNDEEVPSQLVDDEDEDIGDESDKEDEDDGGSLTGRKAPITAFMFYSETEMKAVQKTKPGIHWRELGKELAWRWKNLTAEERALFEAKAFAYHNS